MKIRNPFFLIFFFLFLFSNFLLTSCDSKTKEIPIENRLPAIKFTVPDYDFGEAEQNATVEHIYEFTNEGTADLKLTEVKATCGCTAPQWSKDPIPPGGKGQIKIIFKTGNYINRVKKVVHVLSNDPINPDIPISIGGIVRAYVVVEPRHLNFGLVPLNYKYERNIRVYPDKADELKIKSVTAENDTFFEYKYQDFNDNGKKGIEFKVKIKGEYIGNLNGKIIIELDDPKQPRIEIPVSAQIKSSINLNRTVINFRQKRSDMSAETLVLTSTQKDGFAIDNISVSNNNIKFKEVPLVNGKMIAILVWLDSTNMKPGNYKEELTIRVSKTAIQKFKIIININLMP